MRRIATPLGVVAAALVVLLAPASAGAAFGPSTSFGGSNTFGGPGTGDGQFSHPQAAAVNLGNGDVYVADTNSSRIERFGSGGNFLGKFTGGTGFSPQDVAVAPGGNVYVASPTRIDLFTSVGLPVTHWTPAGTAYGIAVDSSGNVYVSDTQDSQIVKYSGLGTFQAAFSSAGSGDGQLLQPKGMTVDSSDHVYVADPSNGRIESFTTTGSFVAKWSMPSYNVVTAAGSFSGVLHPQDVAVDGAGRVFAPDTGTHSNLVGVFGSDGSLQQVFGTPDSDPGNGCTLRGPWGLATSPSGALYVVSTGEDTMRVFDESSGACPSPNFGSSGSGPGPGGAGGAATDSAKPQVKVTGIPKKCARRDFTFLVHVQDDVLINRLSLFVNRKRATSDQINEQQFDFRVHIPVRRVRREIPRGFVVRVLIAVKATDFAGHKTVKRRAFRICG